MRERNVSKNKERKNMEEQEEEGRTKVREKEE